MRCPASADSGGHDLMELTIAERIEMQFKIEQFYYDEAATLDERRYSD